MSELELESKSSINNKDEKYSTSEEKMSQRETMKRSKPHLSLAYWSKHDGLLMTERSNIIWTRKTDFFNVCIGFSLRITNLWKFTNNLTQYGHGSFLLAYIILLFLVGLPIMFLESCLAQFTSKGVVKCFSFVNGCRGIGYSLMITSFIYVLYSTVVDCWVLFCAINYIKLDRNEIPFMSCENQWNDEKCLRAYDLSDNYSNESSAYQFVTRRMFKRLDKFGDEINSISDKPGQLIWHNCTCLLITYLICAWVHMMNIDMSNKRKYALHIILLLGLFMFFSNALSFQNSFEGVKFLVKIRVNDIMNETTWIAAAHQLSYTIGIGLGVMINLRQHNNFSDVISIHIFIAALGVVFIHIIVALTIYLKIGHLSYAFNISIEKYTKRYCQDFIFIIIIENYLNILPQFIGTVTCLLIFATSVHGLIIMMDTVVVGLIEVFPSIDETQYHKTCFKFLLYCFCSILSLIFVSQTGYQWVKFVSKYATGSNLIVIELVEVIVIVYVYKFKNVERDYRIMLNSNINLFWRCTCCCVTPIILGILTIIVIIKSIDIDSNFPLWATFFGYFIAFLTLLPIPLFMIIKFVILHKRRVYTRRKILSILRKPDVTWGPLKKTNWLRDKFYLRRLRMIKDYNTEKLDDNEAKIIFKPRWIKNMAMLNELEQIEWIELRAMSGEMESMTDDDLDSNTESTNTFIQEKIDMKI